MSDIEKLIDGWRKSVKEYAEAKAKADYLKEFRKSQKAILINDASTKGFKTAQEREAYAYSHQDYITLLDGLKAATEVSEELRWRMEIARARVEVWRTKCANNRKEQQMYGA